MKRRAATSVGAEGIGKTVLEYLAGRFTYHNRAQWRERIAAGQVLHNGCPALSGAVLGRKDRLEYQIPCEAEPEVDGRFGILFEDDDLVAVNKPGNLPCHPAGRYFNHTLWALLKRTGSIENPIFINRIDRETSGVVLVAKNARVARGCRRQFETRRVVKHYLAVVEGRFPPDAIQADGWLAPDPDSPVRKKNRFWAAAATRVNPPGGRLCRTRLQLCRHCNGLSLVAARPETGRCHQIRATLNSLGYPLAGDKLYGVDDTLFLRFISGSLSVTDRDRLRLARQALHAAGLQMVHPVSGRLLQLEAPLPRDMQSLLTGCRRSAIGS